MAISVCCAKCECDWSTDVELISETNPRHCPMCGEQIVLATMGQRSDVPLWVGGEINPDLYDEVDE